MLWNPIGYVAETVFNCTLHGFRKGFLCDDFIYRGTPKFTGLTMAIQEDSDSHVQGALLIPKTNDIISFLKEFIKRETPVSINGTVMDIYTYDFVKIMMPDGVSNEYALTCVVNIDSPFYSKPLTLEEQAKKMTLAYGQNGTNFQYLQKVIDIYRLHNLHDSYTSEIEDLYSKVVSNRQNLSLDDQKWLEDYDKLRTLEERQRIMTSNNIIVLQENIERHLHRPDHLQRVLGA